MSGLSTISGGTIAAGGTTLTVAASIARPASGYVLVDSEVIGIPKADSSPASSFANVTRGQAHSIGAAHTNGTQVYQVNSIQSQQDGVLVFYVDGGTQKIKKITAPTNSNTLGIGFTTIAHLTDSTGGTAGATLSAVGATNTGDRSAAINTNFASMNAQVNALQAEVEALTVTNK